MTQVERLTLRDVMRRVDEVRGLDRGADRAPMAEPVGTTELLDALNELANELERSHRRLIETNVQLVSLREVASGMVASQDDSETTRVVTRYLCRAFGFDHGFLLLVNRETGRLEGTWTTRTGGRERTHTISVPMLGDHGALTRALWLNRAVIHHDPSPHVTVALPDGHPLADALDELSGSVCIPLQKSQTVLPVGETHELCGGGCILGDVSVLAPPPGPDADRWAFDREERQRRCVNCDVFPTLGVIGMARRRGAPVTASDVGLLESIAQSVSPVVETAGLTQALRRSERFRQHLLDSMANALVAVNMRGEVITFNRSAQTILGHTEAETLNHPFGELFGVDGHAALLDTLENGREATSLELLLRSRDGTPVPVRLSTSLLRNEKRTIYGAIATFVDLTPIREAEEQARRLDRLAALGRFTSSVAHEIRNPLAGIGAGVQYLVGALAGRDEHRENLEFILREIKRLDRIVQDLFDVTHPRRLVLQSEPVEDAVRRAVQCLEALASERSVTLEMDLGSRTPPVPHDADPVEQVLINLIKNAVEASPPGALVRVTVTPTVEPGRTGTTGATIRVEDRGAGIEPEHQHTIFEPFFTTKPGGSGLGLYISHDIIKRHGGHLSVSSELGRGTTFTVELPLAGPGGNR